MQVWQRGTANVTTASAYTADRWQKGGATSFGISRQLTSDTTNLPNIQYCMRVQRTAGSTNTQAMNLGQSFESINSIPFAGKTVTFSFYARKGANYSATSSQLGGYLYSGTGTDENITIAYTGLAAVASTAPVLTSTWQRFTATGTVPTTASEMAIYFEGGPTGTAGANDYYEVTGVQIDIGSVALPFRTYAGTIQGELAACQRYYSIGQSVGIVQPTADGGGNFRSFSQITMPVTMRTAPTIAVRALASGTVNKVTSNFYAGLWGGSQADSTGVGSAGDITNNNFMLAGANSTNKFYDGANWTATAEL
jgi:hypothetical protein